MTDEGYVKYSADHTMTPAIEIPQWPELNETRTSLFKLGLIGVLPNGVGFGNISLRYNRDCGDENEEPPLNQFIISGTATGAKSELNKSDYCLVKSFDIARNSVVSRGPIQPSSEAMTHGAVYLANSKVNCVIHIHSRKIFDNMIRDNFPATPQDAAYGTPQIALAVYKRAEELSKTKTFNKGQIVMKGHDEGIIAYGEDIQNTFNLIMELYNKYI